MPATSSSPSRELEALRKAIRTEVACYRRFGGRDNAYENCADRLDLLLCDGPAAFLSMSNPADVRAAESQEGTDG